RRKFGEELNSAIIIIIIIRELRVVRGMIGQGVNSRREILGVELAWIVHLRPANADRPAGLR
ncbi:MAG: hypothetical protein JZD41_02855, partial [Thermoproteus sp.]|nr:hypothetical protein [Thermoproteus sp.]